MTAKAEDGRVARGLRTREAVIDTMLELNAEGNLTPTIEQIAERVGRTLSCRCRRSRTCGGNAARLLD